MNGSGLVRTPRLPAALAVLALAVAAAQPAGAATTVRPGVLSVQQIARQQAAPRPGSEADTLVEPDVAVSPKNPLVAVVASHEGRFPDGGASSITHAWTGDGGRSWRHAPVAGLTTATGGLWNRASDPVLAFAPDGSVYLSTLVFNDDPEDCRGAIVVQRSTDGGAHFGPLHTARATDDCDDALDKNWLVVDNGTASAHRGRLYQFWSEFLPDEVQQRVRWSDDQGRHWSQDVILNPGAVFGSQDSQPVIMRDGSLVDSYLDYTFAPGAIEQAEMTEHREARAEATLVAADQNLRILAQTSHDGGRTWSAQSVVAEQVGGDSPGVRAGLPSATVDPVTQTIHAAWITEPAADVVLSTSRDGRHWSPARKATRGGPATLDRINVDVAAYGGVVTVSYADRDRAVADGRYWQQRAVISHGGAAFGPPVTLGPRYDSTYGAQAGGVFPGDYIGTAAAPGRVYLAWAVASTPPPGSTSQYHQVLFGAVLRP